MRKKEKEEKEEQEKQEADTHLRLAIRQPTATSAPKVEARGMDTVLGTGTRGQKRSGYAESKEQAQRIHTQNKRLEIPKRIADRDKEQRDTERAKRTS